MADFVVLMRAVNVGGRKMPMAELRALCEELGFERPETYIQSGNLIVGSTESASKARAALEKAVKAAFGFDVPLVVRTAKQWEAYLKNNPFRRERKIESRMLHLVLAGRKPPESAPDTLARKAEAGERIRLAGDALWIDFANGVARSKLTPKLIDKAVGAPATARNLNTVIKLHDMLEARK